MSFRDVLINNQTLNRLATAQPEERTASVQLMKVTASTPVIGGTNRHVYTVRTARVGPVNGVNDYEPAEEGNYDEDALSVSELSNDLTGYFSYGVDPVNIQGSQSPRPIPVGTFVVCVPHFDSDGEFIWLIINTQAIDGACT
jgi:hypothetical protein